MLSSSLLIIAFIFAFAVGFLFGITAYSKRLQPKYRFLINVLNSMPSIIIGFDENLNVTQWNDGAKKFTKVRRSFAIGKPIAKVFPLIRQHQQLLQQVLQQRQIQEIHEKKIVIKGKNKYFDLIMYPLHRGDGRGAAIRMDDVTEQVKIKEALVQNEKIMSLGGMAAGMAHEINNPLGIILQTNQNIKRRLSTTLEANNQAAATCGVSVADVNNYLRAREIDKFLDRITISGEKAAEIVGNMLQFSRTSDHKLAMANLHNLLQQSITFIKADEIFSQNGGIEITTDFSPEITDIDCIAIELEQVIFNLLKNAVQALNENMSRHEKAKIEIKTYIQSNKIVIEVSDNGPGISDNNAKKIFEPFFSTKTVGQGTGLGLSISYFIITTNHNGSMYYKNNTNRGSCFVVELPYIT